MANDPSDPRSSDDAKKKPPVDTPAPGAVPPGDWLYSESQPPRPPHDSSWEVADPSSVGDAPLALPADPADALADLPPMTPSAPASGWLDAADVGVDPQLAGPASGASDVIRGLGDEPAAGHSSIFLGAGGSSRFNKPDDGTDDDMRVARPSAHDLPPPEHPSGELFADLGPAGVPGSDVLGGHPLSATGSDALGGGPDRRAEGSSLFPSRKPVRPPGSDVNLSDPDTGPEDVVGPGSSIFDSRPGTDPTPRITARPAREPGPGEEDADAMLFDDRGLAPDQASNIFQRGDTPGPDPGQVSFELPQTRPGGTPESHDSGRIDWTVPQPEDSDVSNLLSDEDARLAGVPDDLGSLHDSLHDSGPDDSLFGATLPQRTTRRPKSHHPELDETAGILFAPTGPTPASKPTRADRQMTAGSWHDRPSSTELVIRRGGVLGWVAGGGIGLLVGVAACALVYFGGGVPNSPNKEGHVVALQSALDVAKKQGEANTTTLTKQLDDAKLKAARAETDRKTAAADLTRQTARVLGAEKKLAQAEADRTKLTDDVAAEKKARTDAEAVAVKFQDDAKKLTDDFAVKVADAKKAAEEQTKLATDAAARADAAAKKLKEADTALTALVASLKANKLVDEKDDVATAVAKAPDALKRAGAAAASTDAGKAAEALLAARKEVDTARAEMAAATKARADAERAVATAKAETDAKVKEAVAAARTESGKTVSDLTAKADALAAELQRTQADFKQRLAAKDEETARLMADARAGRVVAMTSTELRARDRAADLFAAGVTAYIAGRHSAAEAALDEATKLDGTDARVWYFLGLAQFAQGKPADAAFRKGGELEARGLPNGREVGLALEGVYGPARKALSAFRP